jgi:hypothetical protein
MSTSLIESLFAAVVLEDLAVRELLADLDRAGRELQQLADASHRTADDLDEEGKNKEARSIRWSAIDLEDAAAGLADWIGRLSAVLATSPDQREAIT